MVFFSISPLVMWLYSSLELFGLAHWIKADVHQLTVGTFGTESLYTLEFDDTALTLELVGNPSTNAAFFWLALSV